MSNSTINIENIDKVELLKALYLKAMTLSTPRYFVAFDYNLAKEAVLESVNYFMGTKIGCDLSKGDVYPDTYDKRYGNGKFQKIVDSLRENINLSNINLINY